MLKKILVSACLLGVNTKYNGKNNYNIHVLALEQKAALIPLCPEQLGGLPTPRLPVEIEHGDGNDVLGGKARVVTSDGEERTANFVLGAQETLQLATVLGVDAALLKARSPSCGYGEIYDGTFGGVRRGGNGVTAALLAQAGIPVFTEEQLANLMAWLDDNGES